MSNIHVLCLSCNAYLADTDVLRLDWPLTGEMFSIVFLGWSLRPGPLDLNYFCPVCGAFPFSYDPYVAGGNAVGKHLNILGPDGKPMVMTIKQLLMSGGGTGLGVEQPRAVRASEPSVTERSPQILSPSSHKEFPCPVCGAKKRFHKKGCTAAVPVVGMGPKVEQEIETQGTISTISDQPSFPLDKYALLSEKKDAERATSTFLKGVSSRVQGSSADKGTGPPTESEVKEMLADREARNRPEAPQLRPGEGFQPEAAR